MHLTSLRLHGFKSFAAVTELPFRPGLTAIVGPNGSGKSNIADAIRWVLGEQSVRLLRGTRLEDVIFAGSERKKSLGMAEVSLTFDNTGGQIPLEYSEVTVTRRVYRSGESEFFINRTPCRLKDIQELFLDTGLGRGSLSIIGQGEVDAVLNARPEERRAFLEEAAGISKYRVKKREALLKLAQTEEHLVRLGDIIGEVEARLGPLAAQAEAAKAYERVAERLREVEIRLFVGELLELERKAAELAAALREREEHRDKAEAAARALESKLAEMSGAVDALDEEIERLHAGLQELHRSELDAKHQGELARALLERAGEDEAEIHRRIQSAGERAARLSAELERTREALARAREELAPKARELHALEEAVAGTFRRAEDTARALEQKRRELAGVSQRLVQIESLRASLGREEAHRGDARSEAVQRLEELTQELQEEQRHLEEAQRRLAEVERAGREVRERIAGLEGESAGLRAERERLEAALASVRGKLHELSAERRALAEMEAAREGYHRGVREALAAAGRRGWGLLGAVAELIRVSRELETAIEVALGGAAQYIVAERDEDAKQAILHLKETRAGRATFLPLNTLKAQALPPEARRALDGISGVVGVAADLVEVDEACRPAVDYLLGRVVVTRDLDAAMAVARRVRGVSRAVTLDGDLVVPQGAMTGGSRPGRSDGLIARGRQLEELSLAIGQAKEREEQLVRSLAALEEKAMALAGSLKEAEEARRRIEIERISAERDVKEAERNAARALRDVEALRQTVERFDADQAAREQEAAALEQEQALLAEKQDQLRREIEGLEQEVLSLREAREEARRQAEALRLEVHALRQEMEQREREERRLQAELAEAERAVEEEKARLAELHRARRQAKERLDEAAARAQAAGRQREESESRLEELRRQRKAVKDELDALSAKAKEAQARLAAAHQEVTRLLVERERTEVAREQALERLREQGVDDPHDAARRVAQEGAGDPAALKAEVRRLRQELDAMGPVNLASVEEYEEVKKRHAFLTAQRDDLLEAKEKLDQVIARIDRESVEKLQDVYAKVRAAFAATFTRLFGGGKADLLFTDPDDPLESGIDIVVQPPGKRLQNLLALSGGEKALAAIALLFALLEVKPSPFCVLDEIDAALDDHNLERFRALLVEYAARTQFLVITHRQTTMEGADSLFGVTMEEAGVSTLVSLDLERVKTVS